MIQLTVKVRKAAIPARGERQSGMGLSGTFVDMPGASCSTSTLDAPGEQAEFFPTYLKTSPCSCAYRSVHPVMEILKSLC